MAHALYWELWGRENEYDIEYQNIKSTNHYSIRVILSHQHREYLDAIVCQAAGSSTYMNFLIMREEVFLLLLAEDQHHKVQKFQSSHGQVEWLLENN